MPRISASAIELDAAMRLAAMKRARCVRGLERRGGIIIGAGQHGCTLVSVLEAAEYVRLTGRARGPVRAWWWRCRRWRWQ